MNEFVVDLETARRLKAEAAERAQAEPSAPAPEAPKQAVPKARKPKAEIKPADVIKLARKRLREVRREIKRLEKLRAEEDQLIRLLNAADNK